MSNPSDPMQVALDVATLKEAVSGLRQQLTDGFSNFTRMLDAVQLGQREATQAMSMVSQQQQAMDTQAAAIQRIANEFGSWRTSHESDNNKVAEDVTGFKGAIRGLMVAMAIIVVLGGSLVSLAIWSLNQQLTTMTNDRVRIEKKLDDQVTDLRTANKITNDRITAMRQYP